MWMVFFKASFILSGFFFFNFLLRAKQFVRAESSNALLLEAIDSKVSASLIKYHPQVWDLPLNVCIAVCKSDCLLPSVIQVSLSHGVLFAFKPLGHYPPLDFHWDQCWGTPTWTICSHRLMLELIYSGLYCKNIFSPFIDPHIAPQCFVSL